MFLILPLPLVFLTAPLAGQILLAHPSTRRERIWSALALLVAALSFVYGPDTLGQDLVRASGIVFTGALLMLTLWDQQRPLIRAALSAGFALAAVGAWALSTGLMWEAIRLSFESQFRDAMELLWSQASLSIELANSREIMLQWMARIYPGIGFLCALLAGVVSTAVAHHVAIRPMGSAPGPFRSFRFNDHMIWGAVATFGLGLLALPGPWADLVANLAVVWVGLYATRGIAVAVTAALRWALGFRVALFLSAVFLLPYAIGLALVVGLADTWLDLRRFFQPAHSGDEGNDRSDPA